jgi:hypothetical protein
MVSLGRALLRPEIYFLVIYFVVDGLTNPSFADYSYYFMMDVLGISKFFYAMLALIGSIV